ncbi:MAG: MBL fold metallo-hydrolase [Deltaproteobacteria bacterium]|nr:MBL fold metallo-hydrolase [Deltaproteobacteria bacterium]
MAPGYGRPSALWPFPGEDSMEIRFFGGASSIGASCALVADEGLALVVDCGIRQGRGEALPDLAGLQAALGGRPPDAVVLTHAHLDHAGALPLLVATWPKVPVLCTPPTATLLGILLRDAVRVMETDRDEEVPLYGEHMVEATLAAVRPCRFDDPIPVGAATLALLPAGHILGAASVLVHAQSHRLLLSGDVSITSQTTIPGMPRPHVEVDTLVIESTYGDRMHASRSAGENRLCARVAEVVAVGGHVLVPAFAVGRAQEVLLSLQVAMVDGRIPAFPVWADGMVRAVCSAYSGHPEYLNRGLRHRVRTEADVFFPRKLGFQRVADRAMREAVAAGPPCCVVASSGMLAGGASPVYARAWAGEPASLVAVTGYQDEEAPGRALLEAADGRRDLLPLPGGAVEVRCAVERYHLSAHADADELVGLASAVRPRTVLLVHGDPAARDGLAGRLAGSSRAEILLPEDGDACALTRGRYRPAHGPADPGLGEGRPLDADGLRRLADHFLSARPARRLVRADEIARAWHGDRLAPSGVEAVRDLIRAGTACFLPDAKRPYRYVPRPAPEARTGLAAIAEVEEAAAQALPPESGLVKLSLHPTEHRAVVTFELPHAQAPRAGATLAALGDATGWRFEVHPHPRQDALVRELHAVLPAGCRVVKGPSFLPDRLVAAATVHPLPPDPADAGRRFQDATGWRLSLEEGGAAPVGPSGWPLAGSDATGGAGLGPEETRRLVDAAFANVPGHQRPLKVGYPPGSLRLHFAHPGMASLQEDRLRALTYATGRSVLVHPHPVHQVLHPLVAGLVPAHWQIDSPPAWIPSDHHVRVVVRTLPSEAEIEAFAARVRAEAGCAAVVVVAAGAVSGGG